MKTVLERFEEKFIPEPMSGCWLWTAAALPLGYGKMYVGGKLELAHRISYRLYKGPIPEGMLVRHRCDVVACVNPDHLETGTHQQNAGDMVERGRHHYFGRTHCKEGHELTPENTLNYTKRVGRRNCRICQLAKQREFYRLNGRKKK